ncbi:hypothetical protein D3C78_1615170 [compost metagenome]
MLDATDRFVDQPFDFFRRLRAALRQIAYFTGHHRKTSALLTGTRRFNRRVQRQDIGLEGNAVDHAGNSANFLRTVGNVVHGSDNVARQLAALGRGGGSITRQL